jgi:hypothetical protein
MRSGHARGKGPHARQRHGATVCVGLLPPVSSEVWPSIRAAAVSSLGGAHPLGRPCLQQRMGALVRGVPLTIFHLLHRACAPCAHAYIGKHPDSSDFRRAWADLLADWEAPCFAGHRAHCAGRGGRTHVDSSHSHLGLASRLGAALLCRAKHGGAGQAGGHTARRRQRREDTGAYLPGTVLLCPPIRHFIHPAAPDRGPC